MSLSKEERDNYLSSVPEEDREAMARASDEELVEYIELLREEDLHLVNAAKHAATRDQHLATRDQHLATRDQHLATRDQHIENALEHANISLAGNKRINAVLEAALEDPLLGHAARVESRRSKESCCVML